MTMVLEMIRSFLLILALLPYCAPCRAQLSFGARAGASFFNQTYSSNTLDKQEVETMTASSLPMRGVTTAALLEAQLTERFALLADLGYVLKGTVFELPTLRTEQRLNCGEVSVLAKFMVGPGKFKVHLFAGPALAHVFSIRTLATDGSGKTMYDRSTLLDDFGIFSMDQWSATAGAGLTHSLGPVRLFADYRYAHGITGIMGSDFLLTDAFGNTLALLQPKDHMHQVSLGILIPFSATKADTSPAP